MKNKFEQPDHLFKSKLDELEVEVPLTAWDRIQNESAKTKGMRYSLKHFGWAAAIAILLLTVGIWTSRQLSLSKKNQEELSLTNPTPTIENLAEPKAELEVTSTTEDLAEPVTLGRQPAELAIRHTSKAAFTEEEPENLKSSLSAAIDHRKETKEANDPTPMDGDQGGVSRVLVVYITPPVLEEKLEENDELGVENETGGEVLVAAENTSVGEEPEGTKRKGLQKLFKQLKNAKTGEKIDWEELGVSSYRGIANVNYQRD